MTRGLWNLHFDGKWYRSYHERGRISSPSEESTMQTIRKTLDSLDNLKGWHLSALPSPLHSNLDCIYTLDVDAGTLSLSRWEVISQINQPSSRQTPLSRIEKSSSSLLELIDGTTDESLPADNTTPEPILGISEELEISIYAPTALNELQFRFFTDFLFIWRFFLDDPTTWCYPSPTFNTFAIAFLRLAAWDLEVSRDCQADQLELPIYWASMPHWKGPTTDVFWFHGFLIVLHGAIDTKSSMAEAISKAKTFLAALSQTSARLIILSLRHITFVEISSKAILYSRALPLIANTSALQCSPGFRVLTHVLTSSCWKPSLAYRERLGFDLPLEIFEMLLESCSPKELLMMAQASFIVQEQYYRAIRQFGDLSLRSFKHSIPCCGKRQGLKETGIYCSRCYRWRHMECTGLKSKSLTGPYTCSDCQDDGPSDEHHPGGINFMSRRKKRTGCEVTVADNPMNLEIRLSKPSQFRPELRLLGNLVDIPPSQVEYSIRFNGEFIGLAYGLEDH